MALGVRRPALAMPVVERRFLVAGILAAVAAGIVLTMTQPPPKVPILVAGSDLPAGSALGELDITVRLVESSQGFVVGRDVGELSDWSLAAPLEEGEPLVPSLLRAPQTVAAPDLLALTLAPEHAVLGELSTGDLVDIYFTTDAGFDVEASTRLLSAGVYIAHAAVSEEPGQRGAVNVLVAVDDDLALALTSALHTGTIDLVKVGP